MYYQVLITGRYKYEVAFLGAVSEAEAFIQAQQHFLEVMEYELGEGAPTGFWLFATNRNHIGVSAKFYRAVETPRSFTFA